MLNLNLIAKIYNMNMPIVSYYGTKIYLILRWFPINLVL